MLCEHCGTNEADRLITAECPLLPTDPEEREAMIGRPICGECGKGCDVCKPCYVPEDDAPPANSSEAPSDRIAKLEADLDAAIAERDKWQRFQNVGVDLDIQFACQLLQALGYEEEATHDDIVRLIEKQRVELETLRGSPIETLAQVERRHVANVLARMQNNKAATARALGVDRRTLYRMMERHAEETR